VRLRDPWREHGAPDAVAEGWIAILERLPRWHGASACAARIFRSVRDATIHRAVGATEVRRVHREAVTRR